MFHQTASKVIICSFYSVLLQPARFTHRTSLIKPLFLSTPLNKKPINKFWVFCMNDYFIIFCSIYWFSVSSSLFCRVPVSSNRQHFTTRRMAATSTSLEDDQLKPFCANVITPNFTLTNTMYGCVFEQKFGLLMFLDLL